MRIAQGFEALEIGAAERCPLPPGITLQRFQGLARFRVSRLAGEDLVVAALGLLDVAAPGRVLGGLQGFLGNVDAGCHTLLRAGRPAR